MGCPQPRVTGCVAGGGLPGQALPILAPGRAQEEVSVWGHHQRECAAVLPAPPPRATISLTVPLCYVFLSFPPQKQAHKNQVVTGKKEGVKAPTRKATRAPPAPIVAKNNEINLKK